MRPARLLAFTALALALGATSASGSAGKVPRPVVAALSVGASAVPGGGGSTSLFGRVANATSCRITVSPALAGFPLSERCTGSFSAHVSIPAGGTGTYRFTVVAHGRGGTSRPRTASIARSAGTGGPGGGTGTGGGGQGGSQSGGSGGIGTDAGGNTGSLPDCASGTSLLDSPPADPSEFTYIDPLGHMSGPHVLPDQADHIYFYLRPGSPTLPTTVHAPGNATLVSAVSQAHYDPANPSAKSYDYELDFSPCKSVLFWFVHVANLSQRLQQVLAAAPAPQCSTAVVGNTGTINCNYPNLDVALSSGEAIGTTGGPGTTMLAFDFGGVDIRTPKLGFLDTGIAIGTTGESYYHAVCPLDYFAAPVKDELYARLQITNAGANGIPACGTTMQDKAGTLQGNWYRSGKFTPGAGGPVDFLDALAIVHSNNDPSLGVISAGGSLVGGDSGFQTVFRPQSSGTTDREPSGVAPGATVYCYNGADFTAGHHFDLQLVDANTLKIDYEPGDCAASPTLTDPATYVR